MTDWKILKKDDFNQFVKDFSTYVHVNFFSYIPSDEWKFRNIGSHYVYFGTQTDYSPFGNRNIPLVRFSLHYNEYLCAIQLELENAAGEVEKSAKTVVSSFPNYLKEQKWDVFVPTKSFSELNTYLPIGPKSNVFSSFLKDLHKIKNQYYANTISFPRHLSYTFSFNVEEGVIDFYYSAGKIHTAKTMNDIQTFIQGIEKEIDEMKKIEQEVIESIEKIDVTCFYYQNHFYIFNRPVPFYIEKVFTNGKARFRARFDTKYNVNLKLEKLADIIRTKADTYIKKKE